MDTFKYWKKFLDFFGLKDIKRDKEKEQEITDDNNGKIISIYKKQGFRIMVHSPDSFTEVQNIVDELKTNKPIILNLQQLNKDKARRLIDFISGAVYGIDGSVQKIAEAVFLFAPDNIEIDGEMLKDNKTLFK